MTRADRKLQRWIDVLAELLTHRYGRTFEQLRSAVPGYAAADTREAVARMFERDKDDLRALGVPIETIDPADDDGEHQRYRIDAREMYLPFLVIAAKERERRTPRAGYRSVPSLTFEPDELRALADGASRAAAVEDVAMAGDAKAALRKLAFDFPVDSMLAESREPVLARAEPATAAQIRILGQALLRLKRVTFTYHSMTRDATDRRTAEPYGLFFQSGHWYLAARDTDSDAMRNFRVSRMREITVNTKTPQSADYAIAETFRLAAHTINRAPWELGAGDGEPMVIEFRGTSGVATAALRSGAQCSLGDRFREFHVRRIDSFVRWILSFAGEAVPVSPPALLAQYTAAARATLDVYRERS